MFRSEKNFLTLFYIPIKGTREFSCESRDHSGQYPINTEKALDRQWSNLIG